MTTRYVSYIKDTYRVVYYIRSQRKGQANLPLVVKGNIILMATTQQTGRGAVLLTGAAGGIGVVATRRLDEMGFQVFAGVRKAADGEKLRRDISPRVAPILLDITDANSLITAVEEITRKVGKAGLAGLINNAGLIVEGPVELVPLTEVRRQFEVNVIGQIAVTQAFLPLLRQARGRIINISAPTGQVALPYLGILSASKAAFESMTDALRSELRPWGIATSIIEPAALRTDIFQKSAASARQVRQQLPGELLKLYAPALSAVSKALANQSLDDPNVVATAIIHALTSRNPRTRYPAGRGTRMISLLRILPDRTRDSLILRMFGLANIQPGV